MGVIWNAMVSAAGADNEPQGDDYLYEPLARAAGCFYCSEPLQDFPVVSWLGIESEIFLHPVCAGELGVRLITDGRLADKPHLARGFLRRKGE